MSHKPPPNRTQPAVAYFKKRPFEGIVRTLHRPQDDKIRLYLSRTGSKRVISNWHRTREEAFENIRAKCISIGRDVPAMSHKRGASVKFIHQIYGLFRDGKEMPPLFKLSSSAWKNYANRNQCAYKLWTADDVDTLILRDGPPWLQVLYRDVRFPVQRADIGRFFILFKYGGLYADLDVFPNRDTFPQVPLGLCKMLARDTETMRLKPEWEIEVVVATAHNEVILDILEDMSEAMAEKKPMHHYDDKPCRFIYNTTGPKRVGKFVVSKGYEPQVTVFSMCRPVKGLDKHLSIDGTGRVVCNLAGKQQYDVWSAFSMSYKTSAPPVMPPLSMALAELPPLPKKQKHRRYMVKTNPATIHISRTTQAAADEFGCEAQHDTMPPQEASAANVDELAICCSEQQPETHPGDEEIYPGDDAHHITPEALAAFDNMVGLFLTERRCASVNGCYDLLGEHTKIFLRSLKRQRSG